MGGYLMKAHAGARRALEERYDLPTDRTARIQALHRLQEEVGQAHGEAHKALLAGYYTSSSAEFSALQSANDAARRLLFDLGVELFCTRGELG
jgi:hypothetical protein